MTNLFEYIKNYQQPNRQVSYGDILSGHTDVTEGMTSYEIQMYEYLKESDRKRLLNS